MIIKHFYGRQKKDWKPTRCISCRGTQFLQLWNQLSSHYLMNQQKGHKQQDNKITFSITQLWKMELWQKNTAKDWRPNGNLLNFWSHFDIGFVLLGLQPLVSIARPLNTKAETEGILLFPFVTLGLSPAAAHMGTQSGAGVNQLPLSQGGLLQARPARGSRLGPPGTPRTFPWWEPAGIPRDGNCLDWKARRADNIQLGNLTWSALSIKTMWREGSGIETPWLWLDGKV